MKAWRLRTKLTLWSALVTGLALLTFGAGAAFDLYHEQVKTLQRRLTADARVFFTELREHGTPIEDDADQAALLLKGSAPIFGFAFGETNGRASRIYPPAFAPFAAHWPQTAGFSTVEFGRRRLRLGVFTDGEFTLVLASDLHPIREVVFDLVGAYLAALPVVLVVVAAGSWWMARRALQPITDITLAAGAISTSSLDARLPVPPADDEIGRHTRVLNEMFDRLQRGFEQATRFTADASHELRTPLTILRGEIEEALRSGRGDAAQEKLLVGLLEQTAGLQKIADNLLLLARFDAGKAPLERAPVDFSALVTEAVEDAEMLAAPPVIAIRATVAPGVRVDGDAVLLRRVLLNLIDNAVRYNRAGGEVRFSLAAEGSEAVFTLANTGPGIPEENRPALFQRFFRLGADRNRGSGGSGLGLSLCREIVTAHGGRIDVGRGDGDCTEFTVRLARLQQAEAPGN